MNTFGGDTTERPIVLDPIRQAILDAIAAARDASTLPLAIPVVNRLPVYSRDPTSALASLTTCSLNTDDTCGFLEKRKSEAYHRAWRYDSGPRYCRNDDDEPRNASERRQPAIFADRIGVPHDVCRTRDAPILRHRGGGCLWTK